MSKCCGHPESSHMAIGSEEHKPGDTELQELYREYFVDMSACRDCHDFEDTGHHSPHIDWIHKYDSRDG